MQPGMHLYHAVGVCIVVAQEFSRRIYPQLSSANAFLFVLHPKLAERFHCNWNDDDLQPSCFSVYVQFLPYLILLCLIIIAFPFSLSRCPATHSLAGQSNQAAQLYGEQPMASGLDWFELDWIGLSWICVTRQPPLSFFSVSEVFCSSFLQQTRGRKNAGIGSAWIGLILGLRWLVEFGRSYEPEHNAS